ncbi:hypothetical protein OSB04_011644 [Centaurea solstitialis]|uniref:Integrase catalytic domain-containing protein n=1 Tax=Centaurea solstitialis TaxID=347529 RepID=A0AA38WLP5_9ASTR|nr:hypothetical protein OSB04_011644 [Centaurea solstitialis]
MTKAPFKGKPKRATELLEIIHTDVLTTRNGHRYFITFTNDFSRFGYVYLMRNKYESFEFFKEFQNEVENQLGKKIKRLRSDRGREYLSQEFIDHLREHGIVSQLTPPGTPGLGTEKYEKRRKSVEIEQSNAEASSRPRVFKSRAAKRATSRRFMLFTDFASTPGIFAPRSRQKPSMEDSRTCLKRKARFLAPLPGNVTTELLEAFEEPEREFRKRNKKKSKANKVRPQALNFEMGDDAPMWSARRTSPTVPTNPITKPNLDKEIPGKLLHMIKDLTFDGKNDSNPIVHLENFVDICDLFKTEENRDDAIRLRVFPLTLAGEAKAWLRSLEPSSITTWEGLRSNFLSRFFPPSKIDKLRAEIRSFRQDDGETISESWERFKHLLNSCPSHGLSKSDQVQTFYSGLGYSS